MSYPEYTDFSGIRILESSSFNSLLIKPISLEKETRKRIVIIRDIDR